MAVLMKLQVFSFDAKQNTKTILQIARGLGFTDVDAVIVWLENNMRTQERELRAGIKQADAEVDAAGYKVRKTDKKKDDKIRNDLKRSIIRNNEEKKRVIATSKMCPSCNNGKLVDMGDVLECVRPKTGGGGMIKMEHGCGYSELVKK
jgi:hypothetical protein